MTLKNCVVCGRLLPVLDWDDKLCPKCDNESYDVVGEALEMVQEHEIL